MFFIADKPPEISPDNSLPTALTKSVILSTITLIAAPKPAKIFVSASAPALVFVNHNVIDPRATTKAPIPVDINPA